MSKSALTAIVLLEAAVIVLLVILLAGRDDKPAGGDLLVRGEGDEAPAPGVRTDAPPPDTSEPHLEGAEGAGRAREEAPPRELLPLAEDDLLGIVVFGAVTTESGDSVEGFYVYLRSPDGSYRTASGPAGFAFVGVTPGTYDLSCRAEGYVEPPAQQLVLEAGEVSRRIDLVLSQATRILVRLETPEGKSLKAEAVTAHMEVDGLAVVATHERPDGNLPLTDLRNHSRYGLGEWQTSSPFERPEGEIPKEFAGRIDVEEPPPFFLSLALRHVVVDTIEVEEPVDEVTFTLPLEALTGQLATVKFKVVDATTGEPLADLGVNLSDAQSSRFGLTTDEAGVFEQENQSPGLLQLSLYSPEGYAPYWRLVRIEPGRLNDLGTIRLAGARKIQGRVVDAQGQPLAGSVTWRDPALMDFPQELHPNWSASVGVDGAFTLRAVAPVPGWLLFRAKGHPSVTLPVDTTEGDVEDLEVVVPDGIVVEIRPERAAGWHHLFSIEDEAGLPVLSRTVRGPWPISTHLAAGRYTLRIHAPDGTERQLPIVVETRPVELTVPR
jgi:hypothetical protein